MERITLLDTAIGSTNKGDEIIMRCIEEELEYLSKKYFVLKAPTHLNSFSGLECIGSLPDSAREIKESKYKFVCGTNLLSNNMLHRSNQWDINIFNCRPLEGCVLMGVGALSGTSLNSYTRRLYKKVLSSEYIHSVRDEKAYKIVTDLGLKCLHTGCATLWKLTPEFCKEIPKTKSEKVVFTLTDYRKNADYDKCMIDIIKESYKEKFFWIQGTHDLEYLETLTSTEDIHIIEPQVGAYEKVLAQGVDYIGTRLHAGIYAMRNGARSIIIVIDDRMNAMANNISNNCILQKNMDMLQSKIYSEIDTYINLDWKMIKEWKEQFV